MKNINKSLLIVLLSGLVFSACAKLGDDLILPLSYLLNENNTLTPLEDNSLEENTCKNILANDPTRTSGIYTLTNGLGSLDSFDVYCDMDTDGGGWTRITLEIARLKLSGTMTAVEVAGTQAGIDSAFRPFTRDNGGNSTYYYTFAIASGFDAFYLEHYQIRDNSGSGNTSEIANASFVQTDWNIGNGSTRGDVSFGDGAASGPVTSYGALGTITAVEGATHDWAANGTAYRISGATSFRIGWGESGSEAEGWFPWWSGYIYVR